MVTENCRIDLDPRAKKYQKELLTILIHKPIAYVSGQPEKQYQPAVSLITRKNQFRSASETKPVKIRWPIKGLAPAGRLDIDSTGLLVLTQDGRIAKKLISPDSEIEKEYLVRVHREVRPNEIEQLTFGMRLDGVQLARAQIDLLDENYFRMVLTEGRKRQIRRMCDKVSLEVTGLKRVRIGNIRLGSLPVGKWRLLRGNESF